ncbi:hypothetical protein HPB48_017631 [Haemaphysalis longicornis]|uniref:Uncharacterized protein n=1 Tax=Haemaphysalis longicornis TaxID=44386 RepID=A0A9J6GDB5_HAELO|nr:hypothetical protein HPB48_017631 [Haemaphysalis longicornis]
MLKNRPTPGQAMYALYLLWIFDGTHEDAEDALDALQTYHKSAGSLLTMRTQGNINVLLLGNAFVVSQRTFLFR